jgi:hypothetical protein
MKGMGASVVRLLKAKYRVQELFSSTPTSSSPFWQSIQRIKEAFKLGAKFHPGKNSSVSFWKDMWLGESQLDYLFPGLFEKCAYPYLTISQAYSEVGWNIQFRRNLQPEDVQQWLALLDLLQDLTLQNEPDHVSLRLEPSGKFSTRSLYLALCKGPQL